MTAEATAAARESGGPIRIGYARCSMNTQELAGQLDLLEQAGCRRVFSEKISTRVRVGPELENALTLAREIKHAAPGQPVILTVAEMKRLARNAAELMTLAATLQTAGIRLELLTGPLTGIYDPTGMGSMLFAILAVTAQLDRDYIREKTLEGQKAAACGNHGGRPEVIDPRLPDLRPRPARRRHPCTRDRGQADHQDWQELRPPPLRRLCPALDPELSTKARGRVVRAIAARTHAGPFGGEHSYCRDTLDRWIRRYRAGGFDALAPSTRQPGTRIDTTVLELAVALKRENPDRTAAQVARILKASGGWSPSESTLLRLFHRHDLVRPAGPGGTTVFGRFEAATPNERWVGDALHGPKVGGRKTYLFAVLDDHSRLCVGYRFGFAEDTVRLAAALQPALAARGVPGSVYVDNGSAFVDAWLLRACGKLGIRLVHSTPYRPQGRGKIERCFRVVREQFLGQVADTTADDLAEHGLTHGTALLELNRLFTAWVETAYHHHVHSETGQTPLQRWDEGWQKAGHGPAMPSADALTEAFCWSEQRRVTKTATVSLHGNTHQVEAVLVGCKVELVFSPFDLERIDVHYRGAHYGRAVPFRITRHTHPKARPETPEAEPVPNTGIAYLELVADAHQQQIAAEERIGFHALYRTPATQPPPDDTRAPGRAEQLPGQLSIDDALADGVTAVVR